MWFDYCLCVGVVIISNVLKLFVFVGFGDVSELEV